MAWDSVHLFECPTRIFYGWGGAVGAGERLRELGVRRSVLVSDAGLRTAGTIERVAEHVHGAGIDVAVYDRTEQNPTTTNVTSAPVPQVVGMQSTGGPGRGTRSLPR